MNATHILCCSRSNMVVPGARCLQPSSSWSWSSTYYTPDDIPVGIIQTLPNPSQKPLHFFKILVPSRPCQFPAQWEHPKILDTGRGYVTERGPNAMLVGNKTDIDVSAFVLSTCLLLPLFQLWAKLRTTDVCPSLPQNPADTKLCHDQHSSF